MTSMLIFPSANICYSLAQLLPTISPYSNVLIHPKLMQINTIALKG
jgi:hypothetical protein